MVTILTLLPACLLPALTPARRKASRINCVNHLKQIGLAFRVWAMDNNDEFPMQRSVTNGGTMELVGSGIAYVHFAVLSNELNIPKILICPTDTNRLAATNGSSLRDQNISYFVALDAAATEPQRFLSGDDNLAVNGVKVKRGLAELWTNSPIAWTAQRHMNCGNILFADGSVQGVHSARLRTAFAATGVATNRLAIP